MKFGLLISHNFNLGDEIQTLATRRFLPRVDCLLDRENLPHYATLPRLKAIMSGWYMYRTDRWPPPPNIQPLFISFHIDAKRSLSFLDRIHSPRNFGRRKENIAAPRFRDFFLRHQPIGCRDLSTCELLQKIGVEAYFSGCLTLTLERDEWNESVSPVTQPAASLSAGRLLFVDPFGPLPPQNFRPDLWLRIPRAIRRNSVALTHFTIERNISRRMKRAEKLLRMYRSADLVVTSRLHCALACVAFSTPVVYVDAENRSERLAGYEGFFPIVKLSVLRAAKDMQILFEQHHFPAEIERLKSSLRAECAAFTANPGDIPLKTSELCHAGL